MICSEMQTAARGAKHSGDNPWNYRVLYVDVGGTSLYVRLIDRLRSRDLLLVVQSVRK